jgi:Tol biopolymer transport system component
MFDPHRYSPSLPDDLRITSPSWSPDGKRIAWLMWGFFSEQYQEAIGIFDLEAETFRLLHPWAGNGRGPGHPPSGSWSPDGKWLAITPYDPDPERRGVWLVVAKNPDKETFIGASTWFPLWSPDGKWLAYLEYDNEEGTDQVWLYNPNRGEHEKTTLPPGARAVDW